MVLIYIRNRKVVNESECTPNTRQGFFRLLSAQCGRSFIRDQDKVIGNQSRTQLDIVLLCYLFILNLLQLHYERVLDAKDGIGTFIRVVLEIKRAATCMSVDTQ